MTALTEFLYPTPAKRTTGAIFRWWERRRIAYNLAVGTAGLVGLGGAALVGLIPPGSFTFGLPIAFFAAVGLLANICYFLGPVTETLIHKAFGSQVLPTGPALFRMGLTFSVGLGLLPVLISMIGWVGRVVDLFI